MNLIDTIHRERLAGMHILADWWFAKFVGAPRHDNGDKGFNSFMAGALTSQIADRHPVDGSAEARDRFRAAFVEACQPAVPDGDGCCYWPISIGTDYGPDSALHAAMSSCGIDKSRAPWKTHTSVYGAGLFISVADGYRASREVIYIAPVLDRLVRMSDDEIVALTSEEDCWRLNLIFAVSEAAREYMSIALRAGKEGRCDVAYAADAIARLRAHVEASR